MAPFPFTQRGNLAEHARNLTLGQAVPEITLEGLLTGVDNVRTDVYLSPKFAEITRQHIARLLAKYGNVEDFVAVDIFSRAMSQAAPVATRTHTGFIGSPELTKPVTPVPVSSRTTTLNVAGPLKPIEPAEFKKNLAELHIVGLNRAKAENNISIDLLLRLALVKFVRNELVAQYTQL